MSGANDGMKGRICLVTGATSGIGFETALGIARRGATVVIVGRSHDKSKTATDQIRELSGNSDIDYLVADLSIQDQIRRLAAEFKERFARLHVLVNNAGGLFLNGQVSKDRTEMTLALNHLNYFLLTNLLLHTLKASAPSRILNVSSYAHTRVRLRFADGEMAGWNGYKRSKLANLLFTYELARHLEGSGVTANALHPGLVASGFGRNNSGPFRLARPIIDLFCINNQQGAQTSIYLACSPEVEGITGKYFVKQKEARSSKTSYDRNLAARLWSFSAEKTGLS